MRITKRILKTLAASALLIPTTLSPVYADSAKHAEGTIHIAHPFARASATPVARAGATYLTITNKGDAPDRLISIETEAAGRVQLHTHEEVDGVMRMIPAENLVIQPGETRTLRPGSDHLMMFNLASPLKEGTDFTVTLNFEHAGKVEVTVPVLGVAAKSASGGHDDHQGHSEGHGQNHEHGHSSE